MKKLIVFLILLLAMSARAADTKVSSLDLIYNMQLNDRLYILDDPNGTPASKAITIYDFIYTPLLNILLETDIDASAELLAIMDDETGSGAGSPLLVFNQNPTIDSPYFTTKVDFGADDVETTIHIHDGAKLYFYDDSDDYSVYLEVDNDEQQLDLTGDFDCSGTITATAANFIAITEGGEAVYNATETPGGELGGTFASFTIDDDVSVSGWTIDSLTVTTAINATNLIDSDDYVAGSIDLVHLAAGVYAKDIVTTAPITGGTDNVLVGADSDVTIAIDVLKDLVTTAPVTGGTDNILPGSDSDITIALDFTAGWDLGGASSFEVPNAESSDASLTALGQIHIRGDEDSIALHMGTGGEIAGEVEISPLQMVSISVDPGSWYDSDAELFLFEVHADKFPNGIIIDEWKCSCNVDPDVEISSELYYADAWIGLANAAVIDDVNTTNGVVTEDTDANINSGNAIAAGKVMYLLFTADPEGTCTQMNFLMLFHSEED